MEEKKALGKCINAYAGLKPKADGLWEKRGYKELLSDFGKSKDTDIEEWLSQKWEPENTYQETLRFKATQNKMVRSKSEVIIDKLLYEYKIPFCYERPLVLGRVCYYPDFTIMHPRTKKIYYWEHFGKMDDVEYIRKAFNKLHVYAENGIIETINLIATYETLENPLVFEDVEELIVKYFVD